MDEFLKRECYSLARGAAAAGSGYRRVDIRGLRAIKEARGSDQPPKENGERAQSCGDQEARRTTTQRNREIVSKHVTRDTHTRTHARTSIRRYIRSDAFVSPFVSGTRGFPISIPSALFRAINHTSGSLRNVVFEKGTCSD